MEQESAPTTTTDGSSALPTAIAALALAMGALLRVIEFARTRPLWLDEAMLALNIAARPLAQLAGPLDYDQSAPLGYLWIERLAVDIAGVSERTLRFLPFVAALALLPLTWFVVRRLTSAGTASLATVLVALSLSLVTFGAEAKQYGVDPLATIVMVWLTARVADAPNDARAWRDLAIGGVACLLLSQPAVFVLGGAACALVLDGSIRRGRAARRYGLVVAASWSISFLSLYFALYRATAHSTYMRSFWEGTFLDPRAPDFLRRLELLYMAAFSGPTLTGVSMVPPWVMAAAWLAGVVTIARRRSFLAVVASAPLVLAAIASGVGLYGVMDRLFLFAAPLTAIIYASLLASVIELAPARSATPLLLGATAALTLIAGPAHVERVRHPVFYAVGKQVIADVDSMSHGQPVYVAARSFPLWLFYTTDWRAPDADRLRWAASIGGAGSPAHNNAPPRGHVSPDQALELTRVYRGRTEVVGLPTGRQYRTSTRTLNPLLTPAELALPPQPDSGWAELEVNRMASVAHARLWVFGSHMFSLDGAEPALVAELQRRGVRLVMERRQGSTVAYQVEFPGEP